MPRPCIRDSRSQAQSHTIGGSLVSRSPVRSNGFLVKTDGLAETAAQLLAVGEEREGPCPSRMACGCELERASQRGAGGHNVEVECPLPGEGEEPQRGCFQLGRLVRLPGGTTELEGGPLVVGEHLRDILTRSPAVASSQVAAAMWRATREGRGSWP